MLERLHDDVAYDTDPTHAATTAAEAFALKRGVCQDLTHIFIAAARSLAIPARYVGGYFHRDDGVDEQEAGHAWAEAFVPELGWVAFDAGQRALRHRCPCAGRGRARLPRRRAAARHPLRRWRRSDVGQGPRRPGEPADAELRQHCPSAIGPGISMGNGPDRSVGAAQVMTYCCGILVRDGLVMFADTRTNAGVDNIATFRKLHVLVQPGQRIMAVASAGNLSISQSVVSILREGWENPDTGEHETLMNAPTMFQAAQRVGRTIRQLYDEEGKALEASDVKFDVSFLLGGQIKGERPRLFMLYAAGNFIECTPDTPYLQIGEHKYGKPVLDRAITYDIDLYDALKVGLVSVNSTMRSNLSVGLPLDLLIARRDVCDAELNYRIEPGEPYFHDLRERWSAALRAAARRHPAPALPDHPLTSYVGRGRSPTSIAASARSP